MGSMINENLWLVKNPNYIHKSKSPATMATTKAKAKAKAKTAKIMTTFLIVTYYC
jgi:hypothetical protein